MSAVERPHRGTIFVEDAKILEHHAHAGDQYVLRVKAPKCAASAAPGSFVHITCDPGLPMRRPMSIMRVDRRIGWVEMLYKAIGDGTRLLSKRQVGETVSMMGPIGVPFTPDPARPRALLIGGGVGIPPMIFLAETLWRDHREWQALVLMGSEIPFPFEPVPSAIVTDWLRDKALYAMPLLEDWRIPSRLASGAGLPGTWRGNVAELARVWLAAQPASVLREVEIFTCGPTRMLEAVAALAREFGVPCQAAVEEFMACAVGGCAGCTVLVQTPDGPAMKRVCVDGPVFDATTVFPAA